MSGIYIPGMEMPKRQILAVINPNGLVEVLDGNTLIAEFEAVPVPPHGRLGDLDALHKFFLEKGKEFKGVGGAMVAAAAWIIANAPTIIPTDEPFGKSEQLNL